MKRKTDYKKDADIWLSFAKYDLKTAKWFVIPVSKQGMYSKEEAEEALRAGEKILDFVEKTITV